MAASVEVRRSVTATRTWPLHTVQRIGMTRLLGSDPMSLLSAAARGASLGAGESSFMPPRPCRERTVALLQGSSIVRCGHSRGRHAGNVRYRTQSS